MLVSPEKLEQLLVEPGHVKKDDFDLARQEAKGKNIPLDRLLVDKGVIVDENIGRIIADAAGYSFIDLKKATIADISDKLLDYIPEVVAYSQKAIIFEESNETVKLATYKPDNYEFIKHLEKKIAKTVEVYYATEFDIDVALKRYKGDLRKEVENILEEMKKGVAKGEQNTIKLVDLIMEYAHTNMASDVHIEPLSEFAVVRFRVDGVLHKVAEYPKTMHDRIVSRIKILSRLRTDERAAAQDGRFDYKAMGTDIDVRVSIMPVTEGENVVMRLLMQRGRRFTITDLGLLESDMKKLRSSARKPWGMILVVGPTGSGKTTTLYAVLQMLNQPGVNIMTIEDPVEYNIEGVQQTQVNEKKGITFPKGLRSIVRQDPDVIMVGEIRDEETVNMAVNSAMTGHLVLSTLHANDASTTFPRLLEMGVEPFLVASSVNVTIAQRLVRNICEECRESYFLSEDDLAMINEETAFANNIKQIAGKDDLSKVRFYRGKGCRFCNNTGYSGRTAIFEVLEVNEEMRSMVIDKVSSDVINKKAIENGMSSMVHDGITKALMGVTTLDEVMKSARY